MREQHHFGKRQDCKKQLPDDSRLKEIFAITNNGCDSKQIVDFIRKATGHQIKIIEAENG